MIEKEAGNTHVNGRQVLATAFATAGALASILMSEEPWAFPPT